jgi:Uma2 family endonuclease
MSTAVAISVEEYLRTSYSPDCDYVDGELRERNWGEWDHSDLQTSLSSYLFVRRKLWGIHVLTEQRVQVKPTRYRVPDIIALNATAARTPIVRQPPLLCIEILSREDRMREVQERIDDYLDFGVNSVWVLDPVMRRGFIYAAEGMHEAKDGILRVADTPIAVPLRELS